MIKAFSSAALVVLAFGLHGKATLASCDPCLCGNGGTAPEPTGCTYGPFAGNTAAAFTCRGVDVDLQVDLANSTMTINGRSLPYQTLASGTEIVFRLPLQGSVSRCAWQTELTVDRSVLASGAGQGVLQTNLVGATCGGESTVDLVSCRSGFLPHD